MVTIHFFTFNPVNLFAAFFFMNEYRFKNTPHKISKSDNHTRENEVITYLNEVITPCTISPGFNYFPVNR